MSEASELAARARAASAAGRLEEGVELATAATREAPEDPDAHNALGTCLARAARWVEAERAYRAALALAPQDPKVLSNLAALLRRRGALVEARALLEEARRLSPGSPKLLHNLGNVLVELGDREGAVDAYGESARLEPSFGAHRNLAALCLALGRTDDALAHLERAHALAPEDLDTSVALANAAFAAGRHELARAATEAGLAAATDADTALAAGRFAGGLGDHALQLRAATRALALRPGSSEARVLAALALRALDRAPDAEALLRSALDAADGPEAHLELATLCRLRGDADAAERALQDGARRFPDAPAIPLARAAEARRRGDFGEARRHAQGALALDPNCGPAHGALGSLALLARAPVEGLAHLRRAVDLSPRDLALHSNLLYGLQFDPSTSPAAIFEEHLRFAAKFDWPTRIVRATTDDDPERKLRVGLLSPDLRDHSVSRFVEPWLDHADHEAFELVCYSTAEVEDGVTARLRAKGHRIERVADLGTHALAQRIAHDGVDLLVELSGHTAQHRLRVLASRPAPLSLSYLGYPDTTGLGSIDLRITDERADPAPTADAYATERLARLPVSAWCFDPGSARPEAAPPSPDRPVLVSFNNLAKLHRDTLEAWARILSRVPAATLRLKASVLDDDDTRRRLHDDLAALGVAPERVELLGWAATRDEHLAHYDGASLALDTFPYHGTTTTLDALWMGVPVLTLAGTRHVSRVGVSLLGAVGLPELVTGTLDAFVDEAVALLDDPPRLEALRRGLRARVEASSLGDGPRFTHALERLLRQAWRDRCDRVREGLAAASDERTLWLDGPVRVVVPEDAAHPELGASVDQGDAGRPSLPWTARLGAEHVVLDLGFDGCAAASYAAARGARVTVAVADADAERRARASAHASGLPLTVRRAGRSPEDLVRVVEAVGPTTLRIAAGLAAEVVGPLGESLARAQTELWVVGVESAALAALRAALEPRGYTLACPGARWLFPRPWDEPATSPTSLWCLPGDVGAALRASGVLAGGPTLDHEGDLAAALDAAWGRVRGEVDRRAPAPAGFADWGRALLGTSDAASLLDRAWSAARELDLADPLAASLKARLAIETGRLDELRALLASRALRDPTPTRVALLPRYDERLLPAEAWWRAQLLEAEIHAEPWDDPAALERILPRLEALSALAGLERGLLRRLGYLYHRLDVLDA